MPVAIAYNESHRLHHSPHHVERPDRLDGVIERLGRDPLKSCLRPVEWKPADEYDLLRVHSADHVESIRSLAGQGGGRMDADTYVTKDSYAAALDAVGCLLGVTREVVSGNTRTGFAAVRPPGHHATPTRAMGFCLFSNAAIAARWAQHEAGVDRVLIVDFDVHHGNGTQDVFYEDPSVAYMSIHQSPFYPGTGAAHERGHGPGLNTTINIPMPSGTGDEAYKRAFERIFRPIALDYDPDLILLSAGYDAHWKDPLGGTRLSVTGFTDLVREVLDWAAASCGGRLVAVMEGGYDVDALSEGVGATIRVIDDPMVEIDDPIGRASNRDLDVTEYLADVEAFLTG